MIPEQMVPDLELCKKLKELGWTNKTHFFWEGSWVYSGSPTFEGTKTEWCYAPTVAEMGEVLPENHFTKRDYGTFVCQKSDEVDAFWVGDAEIIEDKKEANARAKMLIWLAENGHIDLGAI